MHMSLHSGLHCACVISVAIRAGGGGEIRGVERARMCGNYLRGDQIYGGTVRYGAL